MNSPISSPPSEHPLALDHLMKNAVEVIQELNIDEVRDVVEEIRPFIQSDGGDIEVVDVDGFTVFVRVFGACVSCGALDMTMTHGVQSLLREDIDPRIVVEQLL